MTDKYDVAIEDLTSHPEEIGECWQNPTQHISGCLFDFLTPSGRREWIGDRYCGCPTMVRANSSLNPAWTLELTEAVRNDEQIPKTNTDITVASLPAFAEIQRLADRTIRSK